MNTIKSGQSRKKNSLQRGLQNESTQWAKTRSISLNDLQHFSPTKHFYWETFDKWDKYKSFRLCSAVGRMWALGGQRPRVCSSLPFLPSNLAHSHFLNTSVSAKTDRWQGWPEPFSSVLVFISNRAYGKLVLIKFDQILSKPFQEHVKGHYSSNKNVEKIFTN